MQVVVVEQAGFAPLPERQVLDIASQGAELHLMQSPAAGLQALQSLPDVTIFLSNTADYNLFAMARERSKGKAKKTRNILMTDLPMDLYSPLLKNQEELLLDSMLANRPHTDWSVNELRVTMQKILRGDIFGVEKYLNAGTTVHKHTVKSSDQREALNNAVMNFAEQCRLSANVAKLVWGVSEEMLMNAIYDAPMQDGKQRYQHLPRTVRVELEPHEYATLMFGCDGRTFVMGTADPHGVLKQEKLFQYVKKVLRRSDSESIIDTKVGGAGLGLFKILYSCHAMVCNVEPQKHTEVLAVIDVEEPLRDFAAMARSVHYFSK